ncbi:MAG: HAD-IC family P-type ATPase, partial [Bacilli bacterium]|nr:HAD-IC family P-type ATPase [Bacilli bacterium]
MVDKENPLYYTDSNGKTRKLGRFEKTKYAEERFEPNIKKGLNDFQIKSRVHDRLVNKSNKSYTKSYWKIFTDNFLTFFNIVLYIIAAALISVGKLSSCLFVVIQFANIFIGVYQDIRAKKLIDRMKLVTEAKAEVVRNGNITTIKATDIVLDEIVVLENGKQITVDGVVVDGYIEVNESLITGESKAIKKNPGDAVFAGSFVTAGSAYIRADKIGVDTFAQQLQQKAKVIKKPTSELLNSLNTIFRWISFAIVPFAIFAIFGNYFAQEGTFDGFFTSLSNKALWKNVIGSTAGSLVSMIPAGMFLLTSTTLTVGLIRLSKKRAFVQELYSIESLARVDVLCLDKTGTITDGTMEVSNVFPMKDVTSEDVEMIMGSYLKAVGDNNMTSLALKKRFTFNDKLKAKTVIPFSSDRKCSAVYFKDQGTYALGAPDYIYKGKDKKIKDTLNMYINSGHRVLMLAHSDLPIAKQVIPSTLEPVAIIVLVDHIRDDAIDTIRWFQENDVQIRIISGDNPASVSAIANSVGIKNADKFISLEGMSIAQVESIAVDYTVFGRVSPEQKAAIIRILRRTGHTPAMVGDGVNDILALKEADCSVAMAA